MFYVYIWWDPRTQDPIYVGKGTVGETGKEFTRAYRDPANYPLENTILTCVCRRDLRTGSLCNRTGGGEGISKPAKEVREKIAKAARKNWEDAAFHSLTSQRIVEAHLRPEVKTKMMLGIARRWADPKQHEEFSTVCKEVAQRPEVRHEKAKRACAQWADPVKHAEMVERLRQSWTPERRQRQSLLVQGKKLIPESIRRPDLQSKKSERTRDQWNDPSIRLRRIEGIKNYWASKRTAPLV